MFKFFPFLIFITLDVFSQSIGDFNSVSNAKIQPDTFIYPQSHRIQFLIQTGDSLSDYNVMGTTFDFTGYVPINNSSKKGYLSISSENHVAEAAILTIELDSVTHKWKILTSGKVDFTSDKVKSEIVTTSNFCSGGIMPWGTVIVGEEIDKVQDLNNDGYDDVGWLIEIDPKLRSIAGNANEKKRKLWALGRMKHENICISKDEKTAYFGADSKTYGFLYKFIANKACDLSKGDLFVLVMKKNESSKKGTWIKLKNSTPAECSSTNKQALEAGATNFIGIEDVEIGLDNKIYFTSKYQGKVHRFVDKGTYINQKIEYVSPKCYPVNVNGHIQEMEWHTGDTGNDNLAFDNQGNLWVLNDGGNNGIWVVNKKHRPQKPSIRFFGLAPKGSEPTGITFSPDGKYLFMSIQNPKSSSEQKDSFGKKVVLNKSTVVIISLK